MNTDIQVTSTNKEVLQSKAKSEIQEFYRDKSVFLTGGSGFLGKVLIEKLLRSTDVKCIYMLIRPKKDQAVEERIDDMFRDPLFGKLSQLKPSARKCLKPILGDCCLRNLGISSSDRQILIDEVDIVMHVAATVRFNEPLYNALSINVRATMDLMKLAKNMTRLKSFVHVSSAFANCTVFHIDEIYYTNEINITAESMCKVADELGEEKTNRMPLEWYAKTPNTYTFTKALAEEAVLSQGKELPICIFRPGLVTSTCSEPVVGWVDNMAGPMSILYGVAHGLLHVIYCYMDANANFVPVDMCANIMLALAWNTAKASKRQSTNEPPAIYNFVPDERNMLKWMTYRQTLEEHLPKVPLTNMIWYPSSICVNSKLLYNILILLYHIIPGYIFDFLLMLMGKKKRMVKTYSRIHKQTALLDYFAENTFTFKMDNTIRLWHSLSNIDQSLFNFDMLSINWSDYFEKCLEGVRFYLGKEKPDTIPKARRLWQRLLILHRTVQLLVYGGISALLSWTFLRVFNML